MPDGVLESSPAGYRLAVRPHAVDAIAFESQRRAGRQALARGDAREAAALLRTALGAWRGSALTDVAGEEFAFAPAARLAELRAAATLDRIEADLALGAADAALVGELRELTAADALAERPAALLMRALAATGRQAEALGVYQQIRDRLADRLGVDPSPPLEQAYLAILRQEIPQAAAPAHPASPAATASPARGAAQDRAGGRRRAPGRSGTACAARRPASSAGTTTWPAVLKRLAAERLVTLTGPGGVGKTRLATEAAARLAGPGLVRRARPGHRSRPRCRTRCSTRSACASARSPGGADTAGDPVGRLCAVLADRDAVLVLDNCEHVIDAAAALAARLLADCPRVRILATSREPLRIPGEALQRGRAAAGAGRNATSSVDIQRLPGRAAVRGPRRRRAPTGSSSSAANAEAVAADLPDPGRHAAGHRAGRALAAHADPGPARRAAR